MCGAVVASASSREFIQKHAEIVLDNDPIVSKTDYGTIFMWPSMIAYSCIVRKDQQEKVSYLWWIRVVGGSIKS